MSNTTVPNANKAASALLNLGFTLTFVLACMFAVVQFGPALHAGEAVLYAVAAAGAALVLRSLVRLFRELATPLPAPASRRPLKH